MSLLERLKLWLSGFSLRTLLRTTALFIAAALLIYYPIGMVMVHEVDDDPNFKPSPNFLVPGGSESVATAAALIDREVNRHHWTPNDPWFMPGSMLDRMPAFQRGVISGLARFSVELSDQIGRTRGTSRTDPDLEQAVGLLKYSPYVWVFDKSIIPTKSSQTQYRDAMKALLRYNARVAKGSAVFARRADNLMEALERMATDLGSSSAEIEAQINNYRGRLLDTSADEVFYFTKGRLYAFYLLMRALEVDFADLIREKQLQSAWKQALDSLREGAELRVFFVFNTAPDSQFLPNHLAAQGFYLIRARTQMHEVVNILLK